MSDPNFRNDDARRYLVVCDGGNVRSHAIAYVLKWEMHQEAIAVGRLYMTDDTMRLLSEWAEIIVIVQSHMIESIPVSEHGKVRCAELGVDRWGYHFHPELMGLAREAAVWAAT